MRDAATNARCLRILLVLAAATAGPAFGQCPTNPMGGPSVLRIATAADGAGTDFDLGTKGLLHDVILPALEIDVCLSSCDAGTNAVCVIDAIRPDASSPGLAPPVPVNQSGTLVCGQLVFPTPTPSASGTADIELGEIALQTTLKVNFFQGLSPTSICPECVSGTCSGGANNGGACQVEASVLAGAKTFALSHSCQPGGSPLGATSIPVTLNTATAMQSACPSQSSTDLCTTLSAGTCGTSGCTNGATGITQECCSMSGLRSCFPPSGVTRTGTANAPTPYWGTGSYPKTASETMVNATCALATGSLPVDGALGLPAVAAAQLAVTTTWFATDPAGTTTTTTVPGGCVLQTGIAAVRCLIAQVKSQPLCSDTVDAKTTTAVDGALTKADGFLAKADGASVKKHKKFLKKATSALKGIARITAKAVKRKKISAACQSTIGTNVSAVQTALAAVP